MPTPTPEGWPEERILIIRPGKPKNSRYNRKIEGWNECRIACLSAHNKIVAQKDAEIARLKEALERMRMA